MSFYSTQIKISFVARRILLIVKLQFVFHPIQLEECFRYALMFSGGLFKAINNQHLDSYSLQLLTHYIQHFLIPFNCFIESSSFTPYACLQQCLISLQFILIRDKNHIHDIPNLCSTTVQKTSRLNLYCISWIFSCRHSNHTSNHYPYAAN